MELKSLKIENYKVHDKIQISFEKGLNLIVGKNESGKSTIVDAIHKGLFLQAKGKSQLHKSLASTNSSGSPIVTLEFVINGEVFTLTKEFLGKEKITLVSDRQRSIEGDEAEQKLTELLGEETGVKHNQVDSQWQHLWVLQGTSGQLDVEQVNKQQQNLFQNLQEEGISAVLLSELDKELYKIFETESSEVFTSKGEFKKNSSVSEAQREKEVAENKRILAESQYEELLESADRLSEVVSSINQKEDSFRTTQKEYDELEKELGEISSLKEKQAIAKERFDTTSAKLEELQKGIEKINETKEELSKKEKEALPEKKKGQGLFKEHSQLKKKIEDLEVSFKKEVNKLDELEKKVSCYDKKERQLDIEKSLKTLGTRIEKITKLKKEIENLKEELIQLPEINQKAYDEIKSLESNINTGKAALEVIATGIVAEKIADKATLNGKKLKTGEEIHLTEKGELKIGNETCIRIQPGGGEDLSQKKEHLSQQEKQLKHRLGVLGVNSIDKAQALLNKRLSITEKIEIKENSLDEKDEDGLKEEKLDLTSKKNALETEITYLAKELNINLEKELKSEKIEILLAKAKEELKDGKSELTNTRNELEQMRLRSNQLTQEIETNQSVQKNKNEYLQKLTATIEAVTDQIGDEKQYSQNEKTLLKGHKERKAAFEKIEKEIADADLDNKESKSKRLSQTLENIQNRLDGFKSEKIQLEFVLTQNGEKDFKEEVQKAQAELEEAQRKYNREYKEAQAIEKLFGLYREEQSQLLDNVLAPFKNQVVKYLKIIFGPEVQLNIAMENGGFDGFSLYRKQKGTFQDVSFDALSGGAKEQFANAIRLAMAETLAPNYGGCLPIVLDESFNNTDPYRMTKVHSMLDLASRNGLQVIVLSSDPKDYEKLGAHEINL